jgi:protein SCO1/2
MVPMQRPRTRRRRLLELMVVCAGLACVGAVLWVGSMRAPSAGSAASMDANEGLLNQHGQPFAMDQLRAKTVVLNFIFTHCPGICPMQTQALQRVAMALPESVRERVHFVSVSVDPERDTPEALRAFAAKHGVSREHWTFVTGSPQELAVLSQNYSAQALPEGAGPLDHRTEIRLIDGQGRLLQTYTGNPLDEPRLAREVQTVDELFNPKASP